MCERELPKQERRNCQGKLEHTPGGGRFHVCVGGTTALMDLTHATLYVPWTQEMMEDMVEERPERSHGQREMVKTFSDGISLEEAGVLIG